MSTESINAPELSGIGLPPLTPAEVAELDQRFQSESTTEILTWAWNYFGNRAAIGTSFQGAGLVMLHLAREAGLPFPTFTLDTGLLFPETLAVKQRLEEFLCIKIEALLPDLTVAEQTEAMGPELWLRDPDLCCTVRKVMPLQRRLADLNAWITGLRREQSSTRANVGIIELYTLEGHSVSRDIVKLNPMANWTRTAIWDYIRQHGIPYNPLHDQGYRSIGCQPCTHRTAVGDNERAGRWTGFSKVECGIHTFMSKKTNFEI